MSKRATAALMLACMLLVGCGGEAPPAPVSEPVSSPAAAPVPTATPAPTPAPTPTPAATPTPELQPIYESLSVNMPELIVLDEDSVYNVWKRGFLSP